MEKLYNEENVKRKEAEERERRLRDELEKLKEKWRIEQENENTYIQKMRKT